MLVAKHIALPKMKNTDFLKSTDRNNYSLEWYGKNGSNYRAYVSIEQDNPALVVETLNENKKPCSSVIISQLSFADLIRRGMIRGIRHERQLLRVNLSN